jgi:hypothetical protein
MRIEIKSIDPAAIRYSTCGDWQWLPDGGMKVSVPDYANRNSEFLVALHEMVEAWLCRKDNITEAEVSSWDINNPELEEPGDSKNAPYHHQHMVAMQVEKIVCEAMKIPWEDHQRWVENSANEVDRNLAIGKPTPKITLEGSKFWAELHLFGLRHEGQDSQDWIDDWAAEIPFDGCPCEEHLYEFLEKNPPTWDSLFEWSVDLHNAVNMRIGRPTMDAGQARELWMTRSF